MNYVVLSRIILPCLSFALGYAGYKTIPLAFAECSPSKFMTVKLESVSSESITDNAIIAAERAKWPTRAHLLGNSFFADDGFRFEFYE